jgi:hypothetical protein
MKLTVKNPERVIWSAETREVTVNDGERDITVRFYEGWEGAETLIRINDGELLKSYEVEDAELVELADKIAYSFKADLFENAGDEIDVDDLEY